MNYIYCISGLGGDHRIFDKLEVQDSEFHFINWLQPATPQETLDQYADRLADQIQHKDVILMGVSFGGMMAIELAKRVNAKAVILIASIKSKNELPLWMKSCGRLKLDTLLPRRRIRSIPGSKMLRPLQDYFLGVTNIEEQKIAEEFRENVDPSYLKWSINKILNWKNEWIPEKIYHLHGDNDKLFPISKVSPTHTIKNGGHFMVMTKCAEISEIICRINGSC